MNEAVLPRGRLRYAALLDVHVELRGRVVAVLEVLKVVC